MTSGRQVDDVVGAQALVGERLWWVPVRALRQRIGDEIKRTDAGKPWPALGTLVTFVVVGWSIVASQRLP
ncbi:hypothetical protein FHX42_001587 [Saccharopolyspora lacisalsi]|uniref:Uncharacterized protein n=1 Tax=Halosaccharopolyspora lacisalsi TaxID=1000566 RepID=A0A839DZV4_9PSEU|nr:hypothetical protein [Halosaccharopolyspora lacisalsi]